MAVMCAIEQDFRPMGKARDVTKPAPRAWVEAGKKLHDALEERGISPSEWGRILFEEEGLKSGYQNARNWRNGRGFNALNQRRVIRIINSRRELKPLPANYFDGADAAPDVAPKVRNAALADLLASGRVLRAGTIDALLALDKVWTGNAQYWAAQADVHEGMAAMDEAKAQIETPPPRKLQPVPKRRRA